MIAESSLQFHANRVPVREEPGKGAWRLLRLRSEGASAATDRIKANNFSYPCRVGRYIMFAA